MADNISKFRFEGNDYVVHDTEAHKKISQTNDTLSSLESNTNNALESLENFKSETETFLNEIECSVSYMQDDEYELTLNLNSK